MSKEQQELLDEAYENFKNQFDWLEQTNHLRPNEFFNDECKMLTQEEFPNKCKTNPEFSEKWGLTIEERELSAQERLEWVKVNLPNLDVNGFVDNDEYSHNWVETLSENIPTKLITITYNDKTIESYE